MKAAATIAVERCGDRDVVVDQRSAAPFSIRQSGKRILIAASAAAPVGGDELSLGITVGPNARADIGSVAATMVWPGPHGGCSSMETTCDVADGGHVELRLEPTISVHGSRHRSATLVRLVAGATCVVVEEAVLGRTGEASGHLELSLRVERDGRPLLHHDELFGPDVAGALSSVSTGAARHVLAAVIVGPDAGGPVARLDGACAAARLPVADDAAVVIAVGPDRPSTIDLLSEMQVSV